MNTSLFIDYLNDWTSTHTERRLSICRTKTRDWFNNYFPRFYNRYEYFGTFNFDREWLKNLAYNQWSLKEIEKGKAWEELNIWGNNLTGEIPLGIGNLLSLQRLWIDGNNLSGSIPESIGNLQNIYSINIMSFVKFITYGPIFNSFAIRNISTS